LCPFVSGLCQNNGYPYKAHLENSYARIKEMNLWQKVEEQLEGSQCGFCLNQSTED